MGDVKKWVNAGGLWDPAGSALRVADQNRSKPLIRGTVGNMQKQQNDKAITFHNTLDPGGGMRESTTGVKGSADPLTGKPTVIGNYDPNAPGSVFNMNRGPMQPLNTGIGVPANGVSTNGAPAPYAGGQSPNWSAVIAQALQGPPKMQSTQPVGPRFNP